MRWGGGGGGGGGGRRDPHLDGFLGKGLDVLEAPGAALGDTAAEEVPIREAHLCLRVPCQSAAQEGGREGGSGQGVGHKSEEAPLVALGCVCSRVLLSSHMHCAAQEPLVLSRHQQTPKAKAARPSTAMLAESRPVEPVWCLPFPAHLISGGARLPSQVPVQYLR